MVTADQDGDQQHFASLPNCDLRHEKEEGDQDVDAGLDWLPKTQHRKEAKQRQQQKQGGKAAAAVEAAPKGSKKRAAVVEPVEEAVEVKKPARASKAKATAEKQAVAEPATLLEKKATKGGKAAKTTPEKVDTPACRTSRRG